MLLCQSVQRLYQAGTDAPGADGFIIQRNGQAEIQLPFSTQTREDFESMFKFLYHQIDPTYRFQKSMDVEVPSLLSKMRYPYKNTICKAHLVAVAPKYWPIFVVLLHWMMQLVKNMEQHSSSALTTDAVFVDKPRIPATSTT